MDFVDEKHVSCLKRSKQTGKVSGLVKDRTRSHLHTYAELVCYYMGKSSLSQSRRAMEKHMIKRLSPEFCGLYEYLKVCNDLGLAGEIFKLLRPDNSV